MNLCQICDRPILDTAYVCKHCADITTTHLRQDAELYRELHIAVARQARFGEPIRGRAGTALPYDPQASEHHYIVVNTITTWARHVAEERGQRGAGRNPALYLAEQTDWLRYRREADQAFDELEHAHRLLITTIDRPMPLEYLGQCDCGEELYTRRGSDFAGCRACYAVHEAAERRDWLLRQADDVLGTASEVARFVSAMRGDMVTSAAIRGLAFRGRLVAHGRDRLDRPTYRVGDVLAVLT